MHPLMSETLVADRVRDINRRADAARQVRLARSACRERSAAARSAATRHGRLRILGRIGSSHPRPAR